MLACEISGISSLSALLMFSRVLPQALKEIFRTAQRKRLDSSPPIWSSLPCPLIILARDWSCDEMQGIRKTKKKKAAGMWRNPIALTFSVLLLGAALMVNVGDGPMSEYRGSWLTRGSR